MESTASHPTLEKAKGGAPAEERIPPVGRNDNILRDRGRGRECLFLSHSSVAAFIVSRIHLAYSAFIVPRINRWGIRKYCLRIHPSKSPPCRKKRDKDGAPWSVCATWVCGLARIPLGGDFWVGGWGSFVWLLGEVERVVLFAEYFSRSKLRCHTGFHGVGIGGGAEG